MDYIGSKVKLNKKIFGVIEQLRQSRGLLKNCRFLDGCAGAGAVSRYAAELGYSVEATDILAFSSYIVRGSIGISPVFQDDIRYHLFKMNELKGVQGFFYHNFSPKSNPSRFYFTEENAAKLDAFRVYLEKFKDSNSRIEDYLYYCCLEAMSKVSNTTGVQSAYLKKFKPRALKPIVIEPEPVSSPYLLFCAIAHHKDLLSLLNESEKKRPALYREEILYIDPPYNHRQYGPNYHLYETFVLGGSDTVQGKTGLRDWKSESRSDFCDKKKCLDYLSKVVSATTACLVFVSYNSDGLFTPEEFEKKFSGKWQVSYERWKNRRYRSASSSERKFREDDLYEYLFILERPLTGVALSA